MECESPGGKAGGVGGTRLVLEPKSLRSFTTNDEYLYAMKEDLADWFSSLYKLQADADSFLQLLEDGVLLCRHANEVQHFFGEHRLQGNTLEMRSYFIKTVPQGHVTFRESVKPGTFQARDNVSNFITWCRQLGIPNVVMFETDDLVLRKNEKSVILCLLELARVGAKLGMLAPTIVQMEQEIDNELAGGQPVPQIITCDMKSLDELVRELVGRCTCPIQFPMVKVGEGKYKIGDSQTLIFVRVLRKHVMVRVGGGWDTLEHYLDKHDPCRCHFAGHRGSSAGTASAGPRHHIIRRVSGSNSTLLATRGPTTTPGINTPGQQTVPTSSRKMSAAALVIDPKTTSTSASGVQMLSNPARGTSPAPSSGVSSVISGLSAHRRLASSSPSLQQQSAFSSSSTLSSSSRPQSPAPSDQTALDSHHHVGQPLVEQHTHTPQHKALQRCKSPSPDAGSNVVSPVPSSNRSLPRPSSRGSSAIPRPVSPLHPATRSQSSDAVKRQHFSMARSVSFDSPNFSNATETTSRSIDNLITMTTTGSASLGQGDCESKSEICIDQISTMTLSEFKKLISSSLSIPSSAEGDEDSLSLEDISQVQQGGNTHSHTRNLRTGDKVLSWRSVRDKARSVCNSLATSASARRSTGEGDAVIIRRNLPRKPFSENSRPKTPSGLASDRPKTPSGLASDRPKTPSGLASDRPKTPSGLASDRPKTPTATSVERTKVLSSYRPKTPTSILTKRPKTPTSKSEHVETENSIIINRPKTPNTPKIAMAKIVQDEIGVSTTINRPKTPSRPKTPTSNNIHSAKTYLASVNSKNFSDTASSDISKNATSVNVPKVLCTTIIHSPDLPQQSQTSLNTERVKTTCFVYDESASSPSFDNAAPVSNAVTSSIDLINSSTSFSDLNVKSISSPLSVKPSSILPQSPIFDEEENAEITAAMNANQLGSISDKQSVLRDRPPTPSKIPKPSFTQRSITPFSGDGSSSISSSSSTMDVCKTPNKVMPKPTTLAGSASSNRQQPAEDCLDSEGKPPAPRGPVQIQRCSTPGTKRKTYYDIYQARRAVTPGPDFTLNSSTTTSAKASNTSSPLELAASTSADHQQLSGKQSSALRRPLGFGLIRKTKSVTNLLQSNSGKKKISDFNECSQNGALVKETVSTDNMIKPQGQSCKMGQTDRSVSDANCPIQTNKSVNELCMDSDGQCVQSQITSSLKLSEGRGRSKITGFEKVSSSRSQSVDPKTPTGKKTNISLLVEQKANGIIGGHQNRTEAWVDSTLHDPKRKQLPRRPKRANTPNSLTLGDNELLPRPFEEIKAALTLPINGLPVSDPDALDVPPEDPEMYRQMEQLFEKYREKELRDSIVDSSGIGDFYFDSNSNNTRVIGENKSSHGHRNSISSHSNSSVKTTVSDSCSSGISSSLSPNVTSNGRGQSLLKGCVSKISPCEVPVTSPKFSAATIPPASQYSCSSGGDVSLPDDIVGTMDPVTLQNNPTALVSKIKEILRVRPRRDDLSEAGIPTRIPAPASLSQSRRSRSFSSIFSASSGNLELPLNANGYLYSSADSDLSPSDSFINGTGPVFDLTRDESTNSDISSDISRSETPVPKLAQPLITGRSTLFKRERSSGSLRLTSGHDLNSGSLPSGNSFEDNANFDLV